MAAPTIEAVAAWLRNCSLEGGRGAARLHNPGTAVELESLDSEEAFSYHCEQCLDMRTRELYYGNLKNRVKTIEESRTADTSLWPSFYSSEEYTSDDAVIDDEEEEEEEEEARDGTEDPISVSTGDERDYEYDDFYSLSSNSTTSASVAFPSISDARNADGRTGGIILVVAGCKSCFMYFMVPKFVQACPRCGGYLLHIGGSSCF